MMRTNIATIRALLFAVALPATARADAQADRVAAVQAAQDLSEWMKLVKPKEAGRVQGMSKKPQVCLDALVAMTKDGKADSDKLKLHGLELSIADARAMCEQALVDAKAF